MARPARHVRLLCVVAALGSITLGALPAGAAPTRPARSTRPVARFARPGPYAVGVTTLTIGDRKVEVWYPARTGATRGKPKDAYNIADWLPQGLQDLLDAKGIHEPFTTDAYRDVRGSNRGPFPLVLFSHGFGGWRDQSTFLTTHIASWGFVVASPDFLERGLGAQLGAPPAHPRTEADVLDATIAAVRTESGKARGPLAGTVRKGRIAITGHSAGGRTAVVFGAQPEVKTYIPLAGAVFATGATPPPTPPRKPSLYITGADDGIVPVGQIRSYYRGVPAPKRLLVIDGAGHLNAMSDICEIGKGGGGVVAIAQQAGLPVPASLARLGTDGCFPPALPSRTLWPVTEHFEVAMLRYEMGIDRTPVGLQPSIVKAFPGVKLTYRISK